MGMSAQEAGYSLVTTKPVTLPSIGALDLGAFHTASQLEQSRLVALA